MPSGAPGCGKTSFIKGIARDTGRHIVNIKRELHESVAGVLDMGLPQSAKEHAAFMKNLARLADASAQLRTGPDARPRPPPCPRPARRARAHPRLRVDAAGPRLRVDAAGPTTDAAGAAADTIDATTVTPHEQHEHATACRV
jgi:hypothetical protein